MKQEDYKAAIEALGPRNKWVRCHKIINIKTGETLTTSKQINTSETYQRYMNENITEWTELIKEVRGLQT